MSHTQRITVEVPIDLNCEVELTWNDADGKWEGDLISIAGFDSNPFTALGDELFNKLQESAHDIAVSQLP